MRSRMTLVMAALLAITLAGAALLAWRWHEEHEEVRQLLRAYETQTNEDHELLAEVESSLLLVMGSRLVTAEQSRLDALGTDPSARAAFRLLPSAHSEIALPSLRDLASHLSTFPPPAGVHTTSEHPPCLGLYRTPVEQLGHPPWSDLGMTALGLSGRDELRHTLDYRTVSTRSGADARAIIAGVTDLRCDGRLEIFWTELSIDASSEPWRVELSALRSSTGP